MTWGLLILLALLVIIGILRPAYMAIMLKLAGIVGIGLLILFVLSNISSELVSGILIFLGVVVVLAILKNLIWKPKGNVVDHRKKR